MTSKDGGSAFPQLKSLNNANISGKPPLYLATNSGGMTLRQYYAASCSEEEIERRVPDTVGEIRALLHRLKLMPDTHYAYTADHGTLLRIWARFEYADAMLKWEELLR